MSIPLKGPSISSTDKREQKEINLTAPTMTSPTVQATGQWDAGEEIPFLPCCKGCSMAPESPCL